MDIKAMLADVGVGTSSPTKVVEEEARTLPSLSKILHKRLTSSTPARSIKKLHASAVTREDTEFCPRQYILMDITGKKLPADNIGPSLQVTFDYGRFLESKMQNDWLRDIIVGDWECTVCKGVSYFCKKNEAKCLCSKDFFAYKEIRTTSEDCGISCGVDGLLDLGGNKLTILEIKTMKAEEWKKLKAPKTEHRVRSALYLRATADSPLSEHVFTDVAKIVYVAKGFGGKVDGKMTPFKEFDIYRDDEVTEVYWQKSKAAYDYRQGKTNVIPEGICNVSFCGRAQYCNMVAECFSDKYK